MLLCREFGERTVRAGRREVGKDKVYTIKVSISVHALVHLFQAWTEQFTVVWNQAQVQTVWIKDIWPKEQDPAMFNYRTSRSCTKGGCTLFSTHVEETHPKCKSLSRSDETFIVVRRRVLIDVIKFIFFYVLRKLDRKYNMMDACMHLFIGFSARLWWYPKTLKTQTLPGAQKRKTMQNLYSWKVWVEFIKNIKERNLCWRHNNIYSHLL